MSVNNLLRSTYHFTWKKCICKIGIYQSDDNSVTWWGAHVVSVRVSTKFLRQLFGC